MANSTALKFAYPQSLIVETDCWTVQLRPRQPTLGALVLVCKEPVKAFGDLSVAAFVELKSLSATIERMLKRFVAYERINYLMLMMVDPDVHFHVIPRYAGARRFGGLQFVDAGWPEAPQLAQAVALDDGSLAALTLELRSLWSGGGA